MALDSATGDLRVGHFEVKRLEQAMLNDQTADSLEEGMEHKAGLAQQRMDSHLCCHTDHRMDSELSAHHVLAAHL